MLTSGDWISFAITVFLTLFASRIAYLHGFSKGKVAQAETLDDRIREKIATIPGM